MATTNRLEGMKVAILVENMFEQVEMTEPRKALNQAGAQTVLISPQQGQVQGVNHDEKGDKFPVDMTLDRANAGEFDALMLPGGVANPDRLRMNKRAMEFVKAFVDTGKPIAAIATRRGRSSKSTPFVDAVSLRGPRCKPIFAMPAEIGLTSRV
jgi:protease I